MPSNTPNHSIVERDYERDYDLPSAPHAPCPSPSPKGYAEHTDLYRQKLMHGIEVVNQKSYYPKVHAWCLEKKLTLMATSDAHAPVDLTWPAGGEPRPCTLVFARDASPAAIGRT